MPLALIGGSYRMPLIRRSSAAGDDGPQQHATMKAFQTKLPDSAESVCSVPRQTRRKNHDNPLDSSASFRDDTPTRAGNDLRCGVSPEAGRKPPNASDFEWPQSGHPSG